MAESICPFQTSKDKNVEKKKKNKPKTPHIRENKKMKNFSPGLSLQQTTRLPKPQLVLQKYYIVEKHKSVKRSVEVGLVFLRSWVNANLPIVHILYEGQHWNKWHCSEQKY